MHFYKQNDRKMLKKKCSIIEKQRQMQNKSFTIHVKRNKLRTYRTLSKITQKQMSLLHWNSSRNNNK